MATPTKKSVNTSLRNIDNGYIVSIMSHDSGTWPGGATQEEFFAPDLDTALDMIKRKVSAITYIPVPFGLKPATPPKFYENWPSSHPCTGGEKPGTDIYHVPADSKWFLTGTYGL